MIVEKVEELPAHDKSLEYGTVFDVVGL